ncbi:MAG: hypothetical protein WA136_13960 [Rhodoferax sp.]
MNIALFAHSAVFAPLQGLVRRWAQNRAPVKHSVAWPAASGPDFAPESIATSAIKTVASGQNHAAHRPLRIVRVLEAGQARTNVGRMVISGCMADVCAELDRLAAREAALS